MTNDELLHIIQGVLDKTSTQHVLVALSTILYTRGKNASAVLIAQCANRPAIIAGK